ncbi:hypothetical protein DPEC_G00363800 [Dallia pectoralis]|nr:hypothetical protein DPEC_G00363800 [Dallia pectoralis]
MSSVGSLKLNPSAPDTYITSPITGTGSRVSALYSGQQSSPASIEDNPLFTGLVPEGLLRECDKTRKDTLVSSARDQPIQESVQGVREKVCCVWMCPGCSSERRRPASFCPECSGSLDQWARCESRALWCKLNGSPEDPGTGAVAAHEDKRIGQYRDLIRSRVFDKVSRSRHLSSADIRTLFPECFAPQVCTCKSESDRNPMCASCTHVLTVMQLLARNPCPLLASFAERAIPGRALARNLYDRALLSSMLNDRDLPFCANGRSCKGMLVNVQNNPRPLPSLISPESYNRFVSSRAKTGEVLRIDPCCCILCLLFNQSAAVAQMVSSEGLHLEPHPSGPVYYFNVKLSSDLGVPEVSMDQYQDYLVNFQGSVGSYKPTFYYNWRDAIDVLHRDNLGNITVLPLK